MGIAVAFSVPAFCLSYFYPKVTAGEPCSLPKKGVCFTCQSQMWGTCSPQLKVSQGMSSRCNTKFSWIKKYNKVLKNQIFPAYFLCRWQHPSSSYFCPGRQKKSTRGKGMWVCSRVWYLEDPRLECTLLIYGVLVKTTCSCHNKTDWSEAG